MTTPAVIFDVVTGSAWLSTVPHVNDDPAQLMASDHVAEAAPADGAVTATNVPTAPTVPSIVVAASMILPSSRPRLVERPTDVGAAC
jgi:hypothetical protein